MKIKEKSEDYKPGKVKTFTKAEIKAYNKKLIADAKNSQMSFKVYTLAKGAKRIQITFYDERNKFVEVIYYKEHEKPADRTMYTFKTSSARALWDEKVGLGYDRVN